MIGRLLEHREVNLYGTGENAVRFVLSNRNVVIKYVFDGKKVNDSDFFGHKVFSIEEALPHLRERYTLVAASDYAYWEIKKRLKSEFGLIEFVDFELAYTFGKKICLIYGNCHTGPVKLNLLQSKKFNLDYAVYPIPEIWEKEVWNKFDYSEAFSKCMLFIHQSVRSQNAYGNDYSSESKMKLLPNGCRIISMPNVFGMPKFMFPQIDGLNITWGGVAFSYFYRDKLIEEMVEYSIDDIINAYRDANYIPKGIINEMFDEFQAKLKYREDEWDIKVYQFIMRNIFHVQLFYEPFHPTSVFFKYICEEINKILELDDISSYAWLRQLDAKEVFILDCVKANLGLNYNISTIRNHYGKKLIETEMTLRSYIEQYLMWWHPNYMRGDEVCIDMRNAEIK